MTNEQKLYLFIFNLKKKTSLKLTLNFHAHYNYKFLKTFASPPLISKAQGCEMIRRKWRIKINPNLPVFINPWERDSAEKREAIKQSCSRTAIFCD